MSEGTLVSDALIRPVEEILIKVGRAVAETQKALDRNSADTQIFIENDEVLNQYDLRATWYHMPEVVLELKMSLSMHELTKTDVGVSNLVLFGAPINASYVRNFDYDVAGSSQLKVKFVPIPPPSVVEPT